MYLNLELSISNNGQTDNDRKRRRHFGRIIYHTENVYKIYSYFKSNESISKLISFENEPTNAAQDKRYFHINFLLYYPNS
jgi:hypothetical protein